MPGQIRRFGDLEIDQDIAFQQLNWKIQRRCWAGMAVLIALALLGLFGSGPLSRATRGARDGPLRIEYQRFGRRGADETLDADLAPGHSGEANLWLSREFLEGVQIERIAPEPVRVEAGPRRSAYVFRLADPGDPVRVTIHYRPERPGTLRGRIGLDAETPIEFAAFIYP